MRRWDALLDTFAHETPHYQAPDVMYHRYHSTFLVRMKNEHLRVVESTQVHHWAPQLVISLIQTVTGSKDDSWMDKRATTEMASITIPQRRDVRIPAQHAQHGTA